MKCNLDCSYCPSDLYGGHFNQSKHPDLDQCLSTIDFMFAYVDLYMQYRRSSLRHVVVNVYGGESLYHPHIVTILQTMRQRHLPYASRWSLTVATTTNAVVSTARFATIIPLIDKFTVSYHSEASAKQKQQVKRNLLAIQASGRTVKCVVLMHADQEKFADSQKMISWLQQNNIAHLPRQLDHQPHRTDLNYNSQQVQWFDRLYRQKTHSIDYSLPELTMLDNKVDLAASGRACCGGRQLSQNQNYRQRTFFVQNNFKDWYCSVNHFFLYVKQVTGEIFVNKDCKMNFEQQVAPIGHLDQAQAVLANLERNLAQGSLPVIQCKKISCLCGLCAPKSQTVENYHAIMQKYQTVPI